MDSSKKKKVSKKVTTYCRKFTSRKMRSFCHDASSGNYKHRNDTLLENNKTLAIALQEKAVLNSELQKVLLEYLNKMKHAQSRMLEISSTLKSLSKDCDETALLLTVDDTKWLDLEVPAQFCRKWETRLDKLEESCREVIEVDSMSVNEDVVESARNTVKNSSNQLTSEINSARNEDCITEEFFGQDEAVTKSSCSTDKSDSKTVVVSTTLDGGRLVKEEEKDNPIILKSTVNTEILPELKFDSSDKNSLPLAENASKALINPSLQKHLKSKIPLFSAKSKIDANSSEFSSKEKPTKKRKCVKISEDSDTCRRKTFVIKDAKHLCLTDLNVNMKKSELNTENLVNETMNDSTEMGSTIKNRKTFIVKPSDISEDIDNHQCCSRKTFIKKSSYTKGKSYVNDESDTITSPKHKSTVKLNGESLNIVSDQINSVLNNMNFCSDEKEISLTAVDKNGDAELISEKNEEFQSNDKFLIDLNMPEKNHQEELSQVSEHFSLNPKFNSSKSKNCTTYKEDSDLRNVHVKEKDTGVLDNGSCHKVKDSQAVVENKIEVIDSVDSGSLQKGSIFDLEDKKELNTSFNISNSNPHKHKLNNLSLESLESGMESLLDPNLSVLKDISPLKTSPIKRRVIKPNTKKVFVFNVNNEKSTSSKKSISCSNNTLNQKIEADINNLNDIRLENCESACLNNIEKQQNLCLNDTKTNKKNKSVAFSIDNQTLVASKTHNDCCNSPDVKKKLKITKSKSKAKVGKKCNADIGVIDAITSNVSATNCLENKNMVDKLCTTEVNHTNASFSIPGTVLNEQKPGNCSDLNKKCLNRESSDNKFSNSVKVPFRMKNGQTSKGREAKFVEGDKCDLILDGSRATKFSLKKSSKITPEKETDKDSGCQEKSNICDVEDEIKNLIEEKDCNETAKKCVKRRKNKAKKMSSLKKTGENTFLVEAEIHPPPSCLNKPKNEKENKDLLGLANFQVSVVLKDVFETDNLDACKKRDLLLKDNNLVLKTPLLENSCNIQLSRGGSKNTASVASSFEGYSRRRRENVNYRELACNKKMRRS